MSEVKNVPELRFPEFSENWNYTHLSKLMTFKNGINASKEQYGAGKKFINVLDIIENNYITHDRIIGSVNITDGEFQKNSVSYGDVLFQRSSETREEVGQSNIYLDTEQEATFGGFVIRGKMVGDYYPLFMNVALKTPFVRKEITSWSGGSTRYNIGQESLSKVQVCLPAQDEQQKIADFLSSVDKKIEQLTEKHRLLTEYKKGVMQQIFTQQIRFKDNQGNDYPEWEEKSLKELLVTVVDNRGKTPPVSNDAQNIPLIEVNAIGGKKVNYSKVSKYVTSKVYSEWFRKHLEVGDILFSTVGQTAICSFFDGNKKAAIAQNIVGLRFSPESEKVFMFYLLTYKPNNNQFKKIEMIAVQPSVKVSQMIHINFSIPMKEEQQKIANFLTAIDQKIDQAWSTLEQTKAFKKGLLQKMFV